MSAEPEDDLLRQLGDRKRQLMAEGAASRNRLESAWDRLAAGGLTAEEEAELAERAQSSPEEAERLAAFEPLGDDFHARLMGALAAQREREHGSPPALTPPPPPARRPPVGRRFAAAGGALATAAALLVGVMLRPPLPLPSYAATPQGGNREERGAEPSGPPHYSSGSAFSLSVQPEVDVVGGVRLRCRIARAGTLRTAEWPPCARAERSEDGAFRVAGRVGAEIPYTPGEWTLWVVVERVGVRGRLTRPGLPPDTALAALPPAGTLRQPGQVAVRLAAPLRFVPR